MRPFRHYRSVLFVACMACITCSGFAQRVLGSGPVSEGARPDDAGPLRTHAGARSLLAARGNRAADAGRKKEQELKQRVLDYLKQIGGMSTIAGLHNREPNAKPTLQTDRMMMLTGKVPGLWSGDFLFSPDDIKNRWTMIRECKRQWESGCIVQLMLHVAPPNQPEACRWEGGLLSHLSDSEWQDLVTDGGSLNIIWKSRLDGYAAYLQYLKDNHVPVLFRPHHEMNQGAFWWGGRKGPEGTAKLYRITHDYLINKKGLTNLIWVWDMQDLSRDFADYNPGDRYWDVFAFDIYGNGYERSWYDYILPIAGSKPMAIGECDRLPTAKLLAEQPRWCFFMSWAELTFEKNTPEQIVALYSSPNVITRERLPKFGRQVPGR